MKLLVVGIMAMVFLMGCGAEFIMACSRCQYSHPCKLEQPRERQRSQERWKSQKKASGGGTVLKTLEHTGKLAANVAWGLGIVWLTPLGGLDYFNLNQEGCKRLLFQPDQSDNKVEDGGRSRMIRGLKKSSNRDRRPTKLDFDRMTPRERDTILRKMRIRLINNNRMPIKGLQPRSFALP